MPLNYFCIVEFIVARNLNIENDTFRIMRKIFIGLLIIVVAGLGLLLIAPFFFKDRILNKLREEANKNLNAVVNYDNDLSLNFIRNFPNARVSINNLSIIGSNEFEGDTLLYVKKLTAIVDLMTIWQGDEINVKGFYALEPFVQIIYLENETGNYNIVKKDTIQPEKETTSKPIKLSLQNYAFENGRLIYLDKGLNMKLSAEGVNHSGKGDFSQNVFDLNTETSANLLTYTYGGIDYLHKVQASIKAKLNLDLVQWIFKFQEGQGTLNKLPLTLQGFVELPNDSDIRMDLNFTSSKSEFKNFLSLIPAVYSKDFDQLKSSGTMKMAGMIKGTYNDLQFPAYKLELNIDNGAFKYPALPDEVKDVFIDCIISNPDGKDNSTKVNLNKFHALMGGDAFDARVVVINPVADTYLDGRVKGKINFANISRFITLEQGTQVRGNLDADISFKGSLSALENKDLNKFNAGGYFRLSNFFYKDNSLNNPMAIDMALFKLWPNKVEVPELRGMFGKSDFDISGNIDNLFNYIIKDESLSGDIIVSSNLLDLNQLMNGETNKPANSTTETKTSEYAPIILPENLNLGITANIKQLVYDNYNISNFSGRALLNNSILTLSNVSLKMLDGEATLAGFYNTQNPKKPLFDMHFGVKGFDFKKTFETFVTVREFAPITQFANALVSGNLRMSSELGKGLMPVLESVSGGGLLDIPKVDFIGLKVAESLAQSLNISKLSKLSLSKILLSFKVENGKVDVKPFTTKVFGNINLQLLKGQSGLNQSIDYRLRLSIPRKEFGDANQALNRLLDQAQKSSGIALKLSEIVDVDVIIGGSLSNPEIKTNLSQTGKTLVEDVKQTLKDTASKVVQKGIDDAKKKAREEADKLLAEAQKQADFIKSQAAINAEKAKNEGYNAADRLVLQAKDPIAKIAAQKAAEKLKKETDKKVKSILDEANGKADAIVNEAKRKADEMTR